MPYKYMSALLGHNVFQHFTVCPLLTKSSCNVPFLVKGCRDNAAKAEKGGWRREARKHKVQVKESEMNRSRCSKNIPRSAFFLIFMRKDLSFLSRLKNPGSHILPYGKWHCLLDLLFYSVKLCLSRLVVVPRWCCMQWSTSGVTSRIKMNNSRHKASA